MAINGRVDNLTYCCCRIVERAISTNTKAWEGTYVYSSLCMYVCMHTHTIQRLVKQFAYFVHSSTFY